MLMHARGNRRGGYTLIELMIVIGLLGLAGALLVPHMVGQNSMHLQAAVRQIIGDLSFAQSDALAHQEYRRVHFFADGRGFAIARVNESNFADAWDDATADYVHDPLARSAEAGRYIVDFSQDPRFDAVIITEVDVNGSPAGNALGDIVYDEFGGTIQAGQPGGLGGVIVVTAGDDTFTITVSPFTGKLTVTE